jgi:erythronate-4-phosphate dehydrogenase
MKIVADTHIPFLKGLLEPVAEIVYLPGRAIRREDVLDADALIVRTQTCCNRDLLEGSSVRFIGTPSIGYDHIDLDYCEAKNITWVNAPGCNAKAVAQYVTSSLLVLAKKYGFKLADKTLGIIGAGQCGQKVERNARLLGMNILLNDPPRARNEGEKNFHDLERILTDSDIITLHPTLEKEGPDKTFHLLDASFFARLKKPIFLINTARGAIVETAALKQALADGHVIDCALDCWENEPSIDQELLERSLIATPHIAGYSSDGKANATRTVLEQLNHFFHLNLPRITPDLPVPESPVLKVPRSSRDKIASALLHAYDPMVDTGALKKAPDNFDTLRSKYVLRREYKAYRVLNATDQDGDLLRAFGFQLPPHPADKVFIEN